MSDHREALRKSYPEATQLFGQFYEDYDYEYEKQERAAIDDYIEGNTRVPQAILEVDQLLANYPETVSMRTVLLDLGVAWTIWDEGDDWIAFVMRIRGWLVDSQTPITGLRHPANSQSTSRPDFEADWGNGADAEDVPRFEPSAERALLHASYPEAERLFAHFGIWFAYTYDKDEVLAVEDYIEGNASLSRTVIELDALLDRFPDTASMRAVLKHLGVRWSMWDKEDDWIPFVRRVRDHIAAADPMAAAATDRGAIAGT